MPFDESSQMHTLRGLIRRLIAEDRSEVESRVSSDAAGVSRINPGDPRHQIGAALVDATLYWPVWVHRRVDSVQPLEGARGLRKHSMDCEPPPDPRLAYYSDERGLSSIEDVVGPVVVPLMYVDKGPLRRMSAYRADGSTMPILGTTETIDYAVAMVERMLVASGSIVSEALRQALADIAGPTVSARDMRDVESFIETGTWRDKHRCEPVVLAADGVPELVRTFSTKFLLAGLIYSRDAGTRQVLKVSFHWRVEEPKDLSVWKSVQVAAGLAPGNQRLSLESPHATRSYHLEFHSPIDIRCELLQLPQSQPNTGRADDSGMDIAHVYGSFEAEPNEDAVMVYSLVTPLRRTALAAALFAGLVVSLALMLVDAKGVWRAAPEGPATVLLVAPAILLSFLAARGDSVLAQRPLNVLRVLILSTALSMLLVAATIVGGLVDPFLDIVWWSVLGWNLGIFGLLIWPILRPVLRSRERRN